MPLRRRERTRDTMKNCKSFRKLISRYIDDDLIDSEKRLLIGHLSSCGECTEVLNAYSMLRQDIRECCSIPLHKKAAILSDRSVRKLSRFPFMAHPEVRMATLCIAFALFVGGWFLFRTGSLDQPPVVLGHESSGIMNVPLGAMVYYEEFAGKTVNGQFTLFHYVQEDADLRNISIALANATGYESPLFHDNSLMKQRYDILSGIGAF
jgi:hypothetical protein